MLESNWKPYLVIILGLSTGRGGGLLAEEVLHVLEVDELGLLGLGLALLLLVVLGHERPDVPLAEDLVRRQLVPVERPHLLLGLRDVHL